MPEQPNYLVAVAIQTEATVRNLRTQGGCTQCDALGQFLVCPLAPCLSVDLDGVIRPLRLPRPQYLCVIFEEIELAWSGRPNMTWWMFTSGRGGKGGKADLTCMEGATGAIL